MEKMVMNMTEQYLLYLRKSRADREQELQTGVYDTLQRHRAALLALAKKQKLHITEILEEVVSGDTIADRPQMQRLLTMVESGEYAGVLVMEIARLARGKTRDQGIVSETFRYSNTKIITPDKTYDPANDADEDFFEFSLFMSRQEYKMINKRLIRGRLASLDEGKYIAGTAPYGYEKYKLHKQKGYSLRPNPETAPIVQRIFDLYTVGEPSSGGTLQPVGSYKISKKLNAEGVPSPGGTLWTASAVRDILQNPVYKGELRWSFRPVTKRMENGVLKTSTPVNHDARLRSGLHEPLIDVATWEKAQANRTKNAHPCIPGDKTPQNPFNGLLYCSKCGHAMTRMAASGHNRYDRYACLNTECSTISHRADATEKSVLQAMSAWLNEYCLQGEFPTPPQEDTVKKARAEVDKKENALLQLEQQQNRLYDLLEQGVYTPDVFRERSNLLGERKTQLLQELEDALGLEDKINLASTVWQQVIPTMEDVLSAYDFAATAAERNALLKQAVEKIVYQKESKGTDPIFYIYPKLPNQ